MAKIISFSDGGNFNAVYSIYISDEERKLLLISEEGIRLIQECNINRGVLTHSALSELSENINKELQRLRSSANAETRKANKANAETRKAQGLESYRNRHMRK